VVVGYEGESWNNPQGNPPFVAFLSEVASEERDFGTFRKSTQANMLMAGMKETGSAYLRPPLPYGIPIAIDDVK
jgi:hypothetical protein